MINSELLKGNMTTLVLMCLKKRDMYGYDIVKELQKLSQGSLNVKEGTLYPLLHSLEKDLAIESYWEDSPNERKRKYYRLAKQGRKLLKEKTEQWTFFKNFMDEALAQIKYIGGFI